MTVEYRDLEKYPGYRVGADGSLWSCWLKKAIPGGGTRSYRSGVWHQVKLAPHDLYLTAYVGDGKNRYIHHLILEAFVGERPKGYVAKWKDGNLHNNTPDNLLWVPRNSDRRGIRKAQKKARMVG